MQAAKLLSGVLIPWKKYSDYFDKNCWNIWGLSPILKYTLLAFIILFLPPLFGLVRFENGYDTFVIIVFLAFAFVWILYLPILSILLIVRLAKHTFNVALTFKENVEKFGKSTQKEALMGYFKTLLAKLGLYYLQYKNEIEFKVSEFIDRSPKIKRGENYDMYLKRIDVKYAFRHAKYFKIHWGLLAFKAYWADFADYNPKDRKLLKRFAKSIMKVANYWDTKFREANWRYYEEVGKYK